MVTKILPIGANPPQTACDVPSAEAAEGEAESVSAALLEHVRKQIAENGGWIGFDAFMALALYTPALGYYANASRKFGAMPASGSDFVTAPELTPIFGQALARQVVQALDATGTTEVWEFGAGSGALAQSLLAALGERITRYTVVDVSGALAARQRERLAPWGSRVQWVQALPDAIHGVVLGNEVLDAMPVKLLHFDGKAWFERGVAWADGGPVFADVPTTLRPPCDAPEPESGDNAEHHEQLNGSIVHHFPPGTVTEIHPQAHAFIRTVGACLQRGAAFFIDYGFPQAEYYHPERTGGTVMCHHAHRSDANPLVDLGQKDITAHVNFTDIALAGQDAGLHVLGYTSQAHFLINCGLLDLVHGKPPQELAKVQKLLAEHEMGELFKVIGFSAGQWFDAIGFANGDRSHRL